MHYAFAASLISARHLSFRFHKITPPRRHAFHILSLFSRLSLASTPAAATSLIIYRRALIGFTSFGSFSGDKRVGRSDAGRASLLIYAFPRGDWPVTGHATSGSASRSPAAGAGHF